MALGASVSVGNGVYVGYAVALGAMVLVGCAACVLRIADSSAASKRCVAVRFGVDVTTAIGVLLGPDNAVARQVFFYISVLVGCAVYVG